MGGWYTKLPSRGLSQLQRRCLVSGVSPVTTLVALFTASMILNTGFFGPTKAIRLLRKLSSGKTTLGVRLLFNILTPGFTLPSTAAPNRAHPSAFTRKIGWTHNWIQPQGLFCSKSGNVALVAL